MASSDDTGELVLGFFLFLIFILPILLKLLVDWLVKLLAVIAKFLHWLIVVVIKNLAVGILIFFAGMATNLGLRLLPNAWNWNPDNEHRVWVVIEILLLVMVVPGLIIAFEVVEILHSWNGWSTLLEYGSVSWWVIPACLVWLAGYLWAWIDPRFEYGPADVVMAKTFMLTRIKLQLFWQHMKLRIRAFFFRLGF
jgi:hypothetical protein